MFEWLSGKWGFRGPGTGAALSRRRRSGGGCRTAAFLAVESLEARTLLDASHLLIGTYNVDIADQNGANRNTTYFQTVFAAMGQENAYYAPQAPDILTVTETRSNSVTGTNNDTEWMTQQMNAVYGSGLYSHGTLNGSGAGGTEGIIYNTQTIQLLQETAVGSGLTRQELRYKIRPRAIPDGSADFYVYVGHYKAGSTSSDLTARNTEATQVRANADALGPNVPILYTGDFNADSSTEAAEQTLMRAGNGQAFDPINRPGTWYNNPAAVDIDTIASTRLNGRLDQLWESGVVRNTTGGNGLKDMPATYHPFGNGGNVPLNQPVTYSSNNALRNLANRTTVLTDLTHCSDHIPLLQEYQLVSSSGPATHFSITVSTDTTTAGTPVDVTVQALDANNRVANGYRGTVTFSSQDPYGASLPANYTFTAGDSGVHTFAAGATLYTAGTWDITATDTSSGITGAAYVNVIAAPASWFYVAAPASAASGVAFDVTVYAVDPYGNIDTNYQGTVTWTTTDPDPGVVLPADYTFQPSDQGVVTYPGGVTLVTPGDQFLTATDTTSGITGSADVYVTNTGARAGHGLAALALAQAQGASGRAAAPVTSAAPARTDGTEAGLAGTRVDRFFSDTANGQSLVGSRERPDPTLGLVPGIDRDLALGILWTDLDLLAT